jgi:hypothetical protein
VLQIHPSGTTPGVRTAARPSVGSGAQTELPAAVGPSEVPLSPRVRDSGRRAATNGLYSVVLQSLGTRRVWLSFWYFASGSGSLERTAWSVALTAWIVRKA